MVIWWVWSVSESILCLRIVKDLDLDRPEQVPMCVIQILTGRKEVSFDTAEIRAFPSLFFSLFWFEEAMLLFSWRVPHPCHMGQISLESGRIFSFSFYFFYFLSCWWWWWWCVCQHGTEFRTFFGPLYPCIFPCACVDHRRPVGYSADSESGTLTLHQCIINNSTFIGRQPDMPRRRLDVPDAPASRGACRYVPAEPQLLGYISGN